MNSLMERFAKRNKPVRETDMNIWFNDGDKDDWTLFEENIAPQRRRITHSNDSFVRGISCVQQHSNGCQYKLVCRDEQTIGFICRERIHEYVKYIKQNMDALELDITAIRIVPLKDE